MMEETQIDAELISLLRKRYTPTPVSPCRVCGGPRGFASIGGGDAPTVACDNTRKPDGSMDWEHYERSRDKFFGVGDSEVVILLDAFEALLAKASAKTSPSLVVPGQDPLDDGQLFRWAAEYGFPVRMGQIHPVEGDAYWTYDDLSGTGYPTAREAIRAEMRAAEQRSAAEDVAPDGKGRHE